MKLNIETNNPEWALFAVQKVYSNESVKITHRYESTVDIEIRPRELIENQPFVYPLEGLIDLFPEIPMQKIRVY